MNLIKSSLRQVLNLTQNKPLSWIRVSMRYKWRKWKRENILQMTWRRWPCSKVKLKRYTISREMLLLPELWTQISMLQLIRLHQPWIKLKEHTKTLSILEIHLMLRHQQLEELKIDQELDLKLPSKHLIFREQNT